MRSGTSEPHLRRLWKKSLTAARRLWFTSRSQRRSVQGAWVVLDFFDVIVHVHARGRARSVTIWKVFWGDAARVKPRKISTTKTQDAKREKINFCADAKYKSKPSKDNDEIANQSCQAKTNPVGLKPKNNIENFQPSFLCRN